MIKISRSSLSIIVIQLLICTYYLAASNYNSDQDNSRIPWSIRIADSFVNSHPGAVTYDSIMTKTSWNYEQGVMLEALHQMFLYTGDDKYYKFIKENMDQYVNNNGEIRTYDLDEYNLDMINAGRQLLFLFETTKQEKYKQAANLLVKQLNGQPRTPSGGYWHKKIYPDQMWLDGLYMAEPFSAQYSKLFKDSSHLNNIAKQFILIEKHTRDPKTGLLYHAWDESKKQKWANPETGLSPHFWGRAMGWYAMAIVDVLDFFPKNHPDKEKLINILQNLCDALIPFMDKKTNLWYQVVDQGNREGNYLETSASAMFAYSFAKGYNKGYLDEKFIGYAKAAFNGIIKEKVKFNKEGFIELYGTCRAAGLGGNPYRDGSYEYYISETQRMNDYKGYGPFLMAAIEIEKSNNNPGKGKRIGLDNFYNNEIRKNKSGEMESFHYTWNDTTFSGYYEFGELFKSKGAELSIVKKAAAQETLENLDIYIIVDPDTPKENPNPNYLDEPAVSSINQWVNQGGILMLFSNDKGNCEFEHFNKLAGSFGFHFNEVSLNRVEGNNYGMGQFIDFPHHPLFNNVSKIYMKEISTIEVEEPQYTILDKEGKAVIAFKRFGKGGVFAVGDPWLYNEYIDNRKIPEDFENYNTARNLVDWILDMCEVINYQ